MTLASPKPSISIRKYIKWGNGTPSEPTSTIVLTSPQRQFVDVRLLLPLPPRGSVREASKLDWAFGGASEHDDTANPPHSVFMHWIDSRHLDAEAVRDEGDMCPGTSETESVETGRMVNPATGIEEAYEECWIDGLSDSDGKDVDASGFVLRYEDEHGRGLMVKTGNHIQGVLRTGQEVGVVRWKVGGGDGKEIVAEIGKCDDFPGGDMERIKAADDVTSANGRTWHCIERWNTPFDRHSTSEYLNGVNADYERVASFTVDDMETLPDG
ncbi:hypothetical protein SCUP234_04327 [Seiridium cupressi]